MFNVIPIQILTYYSEKITELIATDCIDTCRCTSYYVPHNLSHHHPPFCITCNSISNKKFYTMQQ